MDLQETIAQLEKQAAQYTDAANTLRALSGQTEVSAEVAEPVAKPRGRQKGSVNKATATKAAPAAKSSVSSRTGKTKRTVSPETRAKIAAAVRARHEARRAPEDAS